MRLSAQQWLLIVGSLALLALKWPLASRLEVDPDEFIFLSHVHSLARGDLQTMFQTFHTHLFAWLPGIGNHEIDEAVAGRRFMYVLRLGSCVLVFLIALRLYGRTGALFAVFAMLAFSYVLHHGEALRADPLISFLFLGSVALLVWHPSNQWPAAGAAALLAAALAISVKTQIYLPAVGGLLIVFALQPETRGWVIRRTALFAAVFAATYGLLYWMHSLVVDPGTHSLPARTLTVGTEMLFDPRLDALWRTFVWDWAFWMLYAVGIAAAIRMGAFKAGDERMRALSLLCLQIPLVTLLIYRNTFEYFYVCIIPVAALGCGFAVALLERASSAKPKWAAALVVVLALPLGVRALEYLSLHDKDTTLVQRQVLTAVHQIFPAAVPYIDRTGLVASFERVNFPMTTYLLNRYHQHGQPVMANLVRTRKPEFLIANVDGLNLAGSWEASRSSDRYLLREDFEFLRRHFIHHWGPVWVLGCTLELPKTGGVIPFEIAVPGPYTLESAGSVAIDGSPVASGDIVHLDAGPHTIAAIGETSRATLRRGERLKRPAAQPPEWALFRGLATRGDS